MVKVSGKDIQFGIWISIDLNGELNHQRISLDFYLWDVHGSVLEKSWNLLIYDLWFYQVCPFQIFL